MKAISLKQPFAGLIRLGLKKIETRKWSTSFRGDLVICSSLIPYENWTEKVITPDFLSLGDRYMCFYGYALCVVNVTDCIPFIPEMETDACCFHYNGFAWILNDLRLIKPIYLKQHGIRATQSFYDIPDTLIKFI